MRLTRHVPEVRGVVTLYCDPDGWRAEITHGDTTELAPLPCPSAGEALHELGLDEGADWATGLAETALRQLTVTTDLVTRRA